MKEIQNSEQTYILASFFTSDNPYALHILPELLSLQADEETSVRVLLICLDQGPAQTSSFSRNLREQTGGAKIFHFPPQQAVASLPVLYPEWDQSTPLNMIFTQEGRLVEATGPTDPKEVRLMLHHDQMEQTFRREALR